LTGWVRKKGPTVIGICCCGDPALVGKAKYNLKKKKKVKNNEIERFEGRLNSQNCYRFYKISTLIKEY
jgi:hypothetical protein